jgi:LysM repeat protein
MRKAQAAEPAAPRQVARLTVSTPTASSAGSPQRPAPSASATARFYVVKAGDTLYSIAQRFDTAVATLQSLNRLSARSVIQPGLRLRLP